MIRLRSVQNEQNSAGMETRMNTGTAYQGKSMVGQQDERKNVRKETSLATREVSCHQAGELLQLEMSLGPFTALNSVPGRALYICLDLSESCHKAASLP